MGRRATRNHILVYTILLAVLAVGHGLYRHRRADLSGGRQSVLNLMFLKGAWQIWRRDEEMSEADNFAVEKSFFKLSLLYLLPAFWRYSGRSRVAPVRVGRLVMAIRG